jgi:hypothetical protein
LLFVSGTCWQSDLERSDGCRHRALVSVALVGLLLKPSNLLLPPPRPQADLEKYEEELDQLKAMAALNKDRDTFLAAYRQLLPEHHFQEGTRAHVWVRDMPEVRGPSHTLCTLSVSGDDDPVQWVERVE